MEKTNTTPFSKKQAQLSERMQQFSKKVDRLSAEECFDWMTKVMYRAILFLGIPYFLYVLVSFIRMVS
ncbi:hypothetical protein NIE88_08265 [Sporolactobacillus shoreicorticis]|uniref:Uncharacterized protein n=1 Tax=Sporolactobacillus shoreicorticis TaxID=1923877 RepID=A0ABW5S6P7_9BACL|nr:hypothetical protein [Sporolactobacillus shoreicorticis]MCO7125763.1 hypothetical protein [Sporolactobacillus shoreicorticis]